MSERLDKIVLTPEEERDALREALNAKRHRISLERNQTLQKIRHLDQQIQGPRSPTALWHAIIGRGVELAKKEGWEQPFQIPDYSYDFYQALCFYFTGDESSMMHYHLSPRKGLMIYGGVGVGKTVMMELFSRNVVQCFQMIRCAKIEGEYGMKDNAQPTIQKYSNMKINEYKAPFYNQEYLGYCFDDLGAESIGNNYGKREFMIDILEGRYDNPQCRGGAKTHIITNLTLDQIAKRYGPRVLDRMRQLFNLIEFPAEIPSQRQ